MKFFTNKQTVNRVSSPGVSKRCAWVMQTTSGYDNVVVPGHGLRCPWMMLAMPQWVRQTTSGYDT